MAESARGNTCLTCRHNTYLGVTRDWVDCCHPLTIERGPKWQPGDPAMVNYRTSDVRTSRIDEIGECPTYELAALGQEG